MSKIFSLDSSGQETLYADRNATKSVAKIGGKIENFKDINFNAV